MARRAVVAALIGLVALSPQGEAAASPAASPAVVPAASPEAAISVPPELTPGGPSVALTDLPPAEAEPFTGVAFVEVGGGCSGVLIAPRAGGIPDGAPAYVLTNGHCIDLLPPTVVRRDLDPTGTVTFGWPGSAVSDVVSVTAIPWASMKDSDLAVLELATPLADLVAEGVRPWVLTDAPAAAGTPIVIVGGPTPPDGRDRQMVIATCTLGPTHTIVEDTWSWAGFASNDCADIRPGSSGSPVLDVATGRLVGLVNTGTGDSRDRSDCMIDRPCEVGPGTLVRSVPDASYGPLLTALDACFDAAFIFTGPGGDCPLDPGYGLEVTDAVEVTNPDITRPDGRPSPTTWRAHLAPTDLSITHYRVKTGPLGAVDCRDATGYGPPIALVDAPVFDQPLPRAEGRYQLCLLAGTGPIPDGRWQEPRFATVVTAWVDRTPPLPAVELRVDRIAAGWSWEPVIKAPEMDTFRWKRGPAATTDCATDDGYRVWRHAPVEVAHADAPIRICVIGYDPAGNPGPPLDRVLE